MNNILYTTEHNEKFWCSKDQAKVLDVLKDLNHGGIGTVYGYVPEAGYAISPKLDLQIITRISVSELYKRKLKALNDITFSNVASLISKDPKLATLTVVEAEELFQYRKQKLVDSLNKTLSGDRSDTARQGHDRNYLTVCQGVKVNLEGKTVDGVKFPNMYNGFPIASSILLNYLEISRKEVTPGQKKVVNSGKEVLMTEAIESLLNTKSVGIRTLSLDPAKFDRIVVSKQEILKEDLKSVFKELSMVEMILELIEAYNA